MEKENKDEVKEDFCPPCLAAIPLAFAATGAGASQAIDGTTDESKKWKDIILWSSVGLTIASILFYVIYKALIYFKVIECSSCLDK